MDTESHINGIRDEATKGVAVTTFLASGSLFFAGLLIARLSNLSDSIKIPILLLFACVVSLTFSAIIYANVTGEINRGDPKKAKHYMQLGNVLSEYLGINNFVASLPLVIIAVTSDVFIRTAACIFAIGGLVLYTASDSSLTFRALKKWALVYSVVLLCLLVGMVVAQNKNQEVFKLLSFIYLGQNALMAFITKKNT